MGNDIGSFYLETKYWQKNTGNCVTQFQAVMENQKQIKYKCKQIENKFGQYYSLHIIV